MSAELEHLECADALGAFALDALHGAVPVVIVAAVNALAHPTLPPEELRHGYDMIVVGQTLERESLRRVPGDAVEHRAQRLGGM